MNSKIAVVVGGAGQIGCSVIKNLFDVGFQVICATKPKSGTQNSKSCVDYVQGDMTKLDQIENCAQAVFSRYGKIDLVVNVIGKNVKRPLEDIDEAIWQEVVDSNLKSVFFLCRTFGNYMLRGNGGSIINFSSTAGIRALPLSPHYIAAKAGVIALTEFFAKVYAPKIRVNCIAPGFVLTDDHMPENYANYNSTVGKIPMEQMSSVDEIAEATLFLANSRTITGHTLVIDGGLIL